MSKVVKLTESDLVRLIQKVLKEQVDPMEGNMKKLVEDCFMQNIDFKDMTKLPTCMAMSTEILKTKRLPTDTQKAMKCANEITQVVGEDPFTAFGKIASLGSCILEKAMKMSPVKY